MTHIKPTHVNKLSLWLNCSTGRDRAGTGRRGAYGQALGTNARLVIFPSLPPLLFFFPHCDRCRVAKFIPNLIAVRQWTQCWIVYFSELDREFFRIRHSSRGTILCRLASRASSLGWLVGNNLRLRFSAEVIFLGERRLSGK